MKRLRFAIIGAIVIGMSTAQPLTPKQVNSPFSITITAPNDVVYVRSPVELKIRLTNNSKREMVGDYWHWIYGNINPAYDYDCRDEKGELVKREYAIMGSLGDHAVPTLKPGEIQEDFVTLSTACDLSKPGRYTIEVSRIDRTDAKHRIVKSNKVTVIVTDSPLFSPLFPSSFQTPTW